MEETPPQPPRLKSVDLSLGTTKQIQGTIVVGEGLGMRIDKRPRQARLVQLEIDTGREWDGIGQPMGNWG